MGNRQVHYCKLNGVIVVGFLQEAVSLWTVERKPYQCICPSVLSQLSVDLLSPLQSPAGPAHSFCYPILLQAGAACRDLIICSIN